MRGLVPRDWTLRNLGATEEAYPLVPPCQNGQGEEEGLDPTQPIFLDGSGGRYSSDNRVRRCGWAWVQTDQSETYPLWHTAGEYGTLPDQQTVPRAEMWALYRALKALAECPEDHFQSEIYSDSEVVCRAFAKGPSTRNGPNGEIWDLIWAQHSKLSSKGCNIRLHKVKAHAVEKGLQQDTVLSAGNEIADLYAGYGAAAHELDENESRLNQHIDQEAFLILHRIIAVCQLFLTHQQREEKDPPAPKLPRLDLAIVGLGHDPVPWGSQTMCQKCFMLWDKRHRNNVIQAGNCPQVCPWTRIPPNLHNPWILPPSTALLWKGKPVHPSHSIVYYRGVIYCNHCGYYTSGGSMRKLSSECRLKPLKSQLRLLNSMKEGIFPIPHRDWPMPPEQQIPGYLMPHVVNGEYTEATPYPKW